MLTASDETPLVHCSPIFVDASFTLTPICPRLFTGVQCQQFDLPQPTLSLGGRAKILLLGMAQRQTMGPEAGETANHYYICISYAALRGAVLQSCRLIDTAQEILSVPSPGVGGSSCGTTLDVAQERGGRGREGGKHPDMRVRWAMTVRVAKCLPPQYRAKSERHAGSKAEGIRIAVGQGMTMLKFDDTPCLEVVEEYSRRPGWQKAQASRPKLMTTSGRAFPGEAVLLRDFSDQGSLLLLDRSN